MNVAKLATDGKKRLRHKRPAMPKYPIDRIAFTTLREAAGYKSDAALWHAVVANAVDMPSDEVTSDRSKISKIFTINRTVKAWEISSMAKVLKVSKDELMIILGIDPKESMLPELLISGTIKQGGTIMLAGAESALSIDETYSDAAYAHRGKLLRIEDGTVGARFRRGDLVEYSEPQTDFDAQIGQEVIVKFKDGRLMLREIHLSDRVGFYTFLPVEGARKSEPITTDSIVWIATIEAIFPPKR